MGMSNDNLFCSMQIKSVHHELIMLHMQNNRENSFVTSHVLQYDSYM